MDDADKTQPVEDHGLSLDKLNEAFAEMLGGGLDPYQEPAEEPPASDEPAARLARLVGEAADEPADPQESVCELTPRSILEAMLFVGHPSNEPLSAERVAGLMRGVRAAEIDDLVCELNEHYRANGCPYQIKSEGAGYRLVLQEEWSAVRDRFYGKVREARLSPAAVEVLALVAYNQPLTAEDVNKARGAASGSLLSQLVRRQLLRLERDEEPPRVARYYTTQRFLDLFSLDSLDDLPRSQEIDRQ